MSIWVTGSSKWVKSAAVHLFQKERKLRGWNEMLCLITAVWTDLYTSGTSYYYMQSFNTYFRHKSNKWTKSFENRLGTFHCKNLMRHSTAFASSQVECQSTACMEIPKQEHWERCLAACWKILTSSLKSAPSPRGSGPHLTHGSLDSPEPTFQTASWLVQPFLQGLWSLQNNRQTDLHTTLLHL